MRLGAVLIVLAMQVAPTQAQDRNAGRTLREALQEFELGHFAEARALFMESYELQPSARVLRGAGMASFELREYVAAYRTLNRSLFEQNRALTDRQREEVIALMDRAESFIGRFRIATVPANADLTIDGQDIALESDGKVWLELGQHTIRARRRGFEDKEHVLNVVGGENQGVRLELQREMPTPVQTPTPPPAASPPIGAIALISVGGALALASVGTGLWWRNRSNAISRCEDAQASTSEDCFNLDLLKQERAGAIATTALAAVGGLTLLTVGILQVLWQKPERESTWTCAFGLHSFCSHRF